MPLIFRHMMRLLFVLLLCLPAWAQDKDIEITMAVMQRDLDAYHAYLKEQGISVFDLRNLTGTRNLAVPNNSRVLANMVIIMQALKLGGLSPKLTPMLAPNYTREMQLVKNGSALIMHQDAWAEDFDNTVYQSMAIIPNGKFVKGLYVKESSVEKIRIDKLEDFRNLTAVSNKLWEVDWRTLSQLNLKQLHSVTDKMRMLDVVMLREVDFTPQDFSPAEDMAYIIPQGRLLPVPGIKLALNGSRHFMVSKIHPDGARVFEALEKGLRIMHAKGTIHRYLTETRFYRAETEKWKTINSMIPSNPSTKTDAKPQ